MENKTKYIRLIIFIIVYIIFRDFIYGIYCRYIVVPFLSKANQSYFVDFIIVILAILCAVLSFKLYKKKFYITSYTTLTGVLILAIYSFYRFCYPENFLAFIVCEDIKYFDIIFCVLVPFLILGLKSYGSSSKIKDATQNMDSLLDEAIENPEKDLLERKEAVIRFKDTILEKRDNKQALAFGIVGRWGSGKSSFANLLKRDIEDKTNYIIVDFNPWLSSSSSLMIEDFFTTIENSIEEYSFGISRAMRQYKKSILSTLSDKTQIGQFFAEILSYRSKSLFDEYEQLNIELQKLNKKVLIFVDDLDRLKSEEVFEILKLIRNTASFSSFIYIVCYDRKYVEDALNKENIPNSESYINKIFLKEHRLSELTASDIYSLTKKFLVNFSGMSPNTINEFFDGIYKRFAFDIQQENILPLNSVRDVKRFTIGFFDSYKSIKDEVVFGDYLAIQLLKFGFYDVYELLFRERDKFFSLGDFFYTNYMRKQYEYRLRPKDERDDYDESFSGSIIKEYIETNYRYLPNQMEQIHYLLDKLFRYTNKDNRKGITFPYRYLLYFREQLNSNDISHSQFEALIKLPYENLQKEILELDKEDILDNFIIRIYERDKLSFVNKTEFEVYVQILFFIGDSIANKSIKPSIGIDFDYLRVLLIENKNSIRDRFYSSDEEFKTFLIVTLKNRASTPFTFQMEFCKDVLGLPLDTLDESYPVKREEFKGIMIHFFKEYTRNMSAVTSDFWELYHFSKITEWKDRGGYNKFIPEIVKIFQKDVFPRFIDDFLVLLLKPQDWYGDTSRDYRVAIGEIPLELWDTPQNFIDYLESKELKDKIKNTSNFIDEFVVFAKEVLKQNRFIAYNFTYTPAIEKLKKVEKHNNKN